MAQRKRDARSTSHMVFNRTGEDGITRAIVGLPTGEGYIAHCRSLPITGLRPTFILRVRWYDVQPGAK